MDLWRIGKLIDGVVKEGLRLLEKDPQPFGVILKDKVEKKNKYSDNLIRHRIKLFRSLFVFCFFPFGISDYKIQTNLLAESFKLLKESSDWKISE